VRRRWNTELDISTALLALASSSKQLEIYGSKWREQQTISALVWELFEWKCSYIVPQKGLFTPNQSSISITGFNPSKKLKRSWNCRQKEKKGRKSRFYKNLLNFSNVFLKFERAIYKKDCFTLLQVLNRFMILTWEIIYNTKEYIMFTYKVFCIISCHISFVPQGEWRDFVALNCCIHPAISFIVVLWLILLKYEYISSWFYIRVASSSWMYLAVGKQGHRVSRQV
jgi:hypothetical protein